MSRAITLPDPGTVAIVDMAAACRSVYERRDELIGSLPLDEAREYQRQSAAIETYLRGTEAYPEAQRAARVLEMAVGAALGVNAKGGRGKPFPAGQGLDEHLRHEFRTLARQRELIEPRLEEVDEKGKPIGLSREAALVIARPVRVETIRDRRARAIRPATPDQDATGLGWQILAGDFNDRGEVADSSVDLILTDPPYGVDLAYLWSELGAYAARVLRPGGILAAMSGKLHVDDRMRRLGEHLTYGWMYAQPLPGSSTRLVARHIAQEWKPWLCYSKGKWPSGRLDWHGDLLPAGPRAKGEYEWQQQLEPAMALVERLTSLGHLVVDPFCGSGTFGVASVSTGRLFIGIDIDADRVATATRRLQVVAP